MTHASQESVTRFVWYPYFLCIRNFTTLFLLPPSVLLGFDHVSPSTLLSVFSSPTFWLTSLKYPSASLLLLSPLFFVPPLSSYNPTPLHLSFPSHFYTQTHHNHHPLPPGLIISLQLLRGELEQIRRENQAVFNRALALTRKLGFPDVILPGKEAKSSRQ